MIRSWLLYLGALTASLVFHAYYTGWYSWFLLVLALCLPAFSLLISLPAMLRARLFLHAPSCCTKGQSFYAALRGASGFLPLPKCRFQLVVTAVMSGRTTVLQQKVPGRSSWYVPLKTDHCGVLQLSVRKTRVYDYLRLFCLPVRRPEPMEVTVFPTPQQPEHLPNLTQFLVRRRQPKPGGGFSEEHEMRDYRPGDSMRDIHWKLSVKTDRLIVREAQEPIRGTALLTFDLSGSPEQVDSTLEQLLWMSQWLLEHDTPHQIAWLNPITLQPDTVSVSDEDALSVLLYGLLRTELKQNVPSIAERRFPSVSWRYHIQPKEEDAP